MKINVFNRALSNGTGLTTMIVAVCCGAASFAQPAMEMNERDRQIRERYEASLRQNPFGQQAFDHVFESYLANEGAAAWVHALELRLASAGGTDADKVILARIFHRQFRTRDAIKLLEDARLANQDDPEIAGLLGLLKAEAGNYQEAADLLANAVDRMTDASKRADACRLLGDAYLHLGNRDKALDAWKKLIEMAPDDSFAYEEMASILDDNFMWREAIEVRRTLIEKSAANPYLQCRLLRSIGENYDRLDLPAEAIAAYEQALNLAAPGNWLYEDLKSRLVAVYEKKGDLSGLLAYLDARIAQFPSDAANTDLKAVVLKRMGRTEEAEAVILAVLERDPARLASYEMLIDLYTETSSHDKKVQLFERLVEMFPEDPNYLRRLGEAHLRAGNIDAARKAWNRIAGDSDEAGALALLGEWLEQYDFPDEAADAFEKAIAIRKEKEWVFTLAEIKHSKGLDDEAKTLWMSSLTPESSASDYAEVAAILTARGSEIDAIALYEKAIALDPAAYENRAALTKLLMKREAYDQALEQFTLLAGLQDNEYFQMLGERGLLDVYFAQGVLADKQKSWENEVVQNPGAVPPRQRLARLYLRMGDKDRAVDLLKQCAELEPDQPEHLRQMADIYTMLRQNTLAMETFEKLIGLDPTRAGAYYRQLVQLHRASGETQKAIESAEKVVELAPADADARSVLAQVYLQTDKKDEGLQQYRNALRLKPDDPELYREYGDALVRFEKWGEAQETFRRMRESATADAVRIEAVSRLAAIYVQQNKIADLLQEFQDRVRKTPQALLPYQELAAIHKAIGNFQAALEIAESAAEAADDKEAALRSLMIVAHEANRLDKVVQVHEQLIQLAGKPTVLDLDRLGLAYAALGDFEKAMQAWNQIEAIAPNDAAAAKTVARAYSNHGLLDEALAARSRAIKLDPTDYNFRFETAQLLASQDRSDEALAELTDLLETVQWENEPTPTALQQQTGSTTTSPLPGAMPAQMWAGSRQARMRYFGIQGQGVKGLRAAIVQSIYEIAQRLEGLDEILAKMEKRALDIPDNLNIQEDLLQFYSLAGKKNEAIQVATRLAARQPGNIDIRWNLANMLQQEKEFDKVEAIYHEIAQIDPQQSLNTKFATARLYRVRQEPDKARNLIEQLLASHPDDAGTLQQAAQFYRSEGDAETFDQLNQRLIEMDPQRAVDYRMQSASFYRDRGDEAKAREAYETAIFHRSDQPGLNRYFSGYRQQVYSPDRNIGRRGGRNDLRALTYQVTVPIDYSRIEAFNQLFQMSETQEELKPIVDRLRSEAELCFNGESDTDRAYGRQTLVLMLCYLDFTEQFAEAAEWAGKLRELDPADVNAANLELYFLHRLEKYEEMEKGYARLATIAPTLANPIGDARINLALIQNKIDDAIALAESFGPQVNSTRQIDAIARRLVQAKQPEKAIALLEKYTSTPSTSRQVMSSLLNAYESAGLNDKALEWARKWWEREVGTIPAQAAMNNSQLRQGADVAFNYLFNCYMRSERVQELVSEFEDRLAAQPASTTWRQYLIRIYQSTNRIDDAVKLYEELIAMRPNSTDAKTQFAEFLMQNNRAKDAIGIYEDLLRRNPRLYFSMNMQIREAYKQAGQQDQLAAIEQSAIERTTNPDELERMAQQWFNDQDYERAAEAFQRAIRIDANRDHVRIAIADAYARQDKDPEALDALRELMDRSDAKDSQQVEGFQTADRIVSLFGDVDAMEELKQRLAGMKEKSPESPRTLRFTVAIAKHENRYADAMASLEHALASLASSDSNNRYVRSSIYEEMVVVAEKQGDFEKAITILKEELIPGGNRNWSKLAALYLKNGDKTNAIEAWKKDAADQGGGWAQVQVLRNMLQQDMAEEAAAYYRESRAKAASDENAAQQMDDVFVDAAGNNRALRPFVESEVLGVSAANSSRMIESYLQRIDPSPQDLDRVMTPLLASRTDDERLLSLYVDYLGRLDQHEKQETVLRQLTELNPESPDYVTRYGRVLLDRKKPGEAIEVLSAWAMRDPGPERIRGLLEIAFDYRANVNAFALRDKFLALTPDEKRGDVESLFAHHIANAGDPHWSRDVFRRRHEANPTQATLSDYFTFLSNWSYEAETRELLASLRSGGEDALAQLPPAATIKALLAEGDVENAEALAMKLLIQSTTVSPATSTQYGQWYGNRSDDLSRALDDYIGARALALRLEEKLRSKGDSSAATHLGLAKFFTRIDEFEHARNISFAALDKIGDKQEVRNQLMGMIGSSRNRADALKELEACHRYLVDHSLLDSAAAQTLVVQYMELDCPDRARAAIDNMQLQTNRPGEYMERAKLYIYIGDGEKASADIASAGEDASKVHYLPTRAAALAMTGRMDEAKDALREESHNQNWRHLFGELVQARQYALAVEMFRDELQNQLGDMWLARTYADALIKAGAPAESWQEVMRNVRSKVNENTRDQIVGIYRQLLDDNRLLDNVSAIPNLNSDPVLQLAVCQGLRDRTTRGVDSAVDTLRLLLMEIQEPDNETLIITASCWETIGDKAEATVRYKKIVADPDANAESLNHAARGLWEADPAASATAYLRLLDLNPRSVIGSYRIYRLVGRCGDESLANNFREKLASVVTSPSQAKLAFAAIDAEAGQTQNAIESLNSLLDDPMVYGQSAAEAAAIAEEAGDLALARRYYEKVVQGGCRPDTQRTALEALTTLCAQQGEIDRAFTYFCRLSSTERLRATTAWNALCSNAAPDVLRRLAKEAVPKVPDNDRCSDLLSLCVQNQKYHGLHGNLSDLAADLAVNGRELEEAVMNGKQIVDWTISDMYALPEGASSMQQDPSTGITSVLAQASPLKANGRSWKPLSPLQPGGILWMDRILDLEFQETPRKAVLAVTDVTCPAEAQVTFSHASDDWTRVWINGKKVHENYEGRNLFWDQDRFDATLVQGQNRIVVEIGNNYNTWGFALAMMNAPEGTVTSAPSATP
ncbi:MAG: hypothetical protein AMXMBFR84_05270 [Candidatus Hydrogenedentota bacterium]